MQTHTLATIETVIQADSTISQEHQSRILDAARTQQPHRRLVTTREACHILDPKHPVCTATVRRYAKRGLLTPIKTSATRLRWDAAEVERLATLGADAMREQDAA